MNLTPMQLFCQEKILLSLYPWFSIEEIDAKEIKHFWCMINIDYQDQYIWEWWKECYSDIDNKTLYMWLKWYTIDDNFDLPDTIKSWYDDIFESHISIIGLPPTLPRVLKSLEKYKWISLSYYAWVIIRCRWEEIHRKLLNEDKTDANLRNQTPETQLAIAKLLCREE